MSLGLTLYFAVLCGILWFKNLCFACVCCYGCWCYLAYWLLFIEYFVECRLRVCFIAWLDCLVFDLCFASLRWVIWLWVMFDVVYLFVYLWFLLLVFYVLLFNFDYCLLICVFDVVVGLFGLFCFVWSCFLDLIGCYNVDLLVVGISACLVVWRMYYLVIYLLLSVTLVWVCFGWSIRLVWVCGYCGLCC